MLGCMLAICEETGLMAVPCRKADAAVQVLRQAMAKLRRSKYSLGAKACCCSLLKGRNAKDERVIRLATRGLLGVFNLQ